MNPHIIDLYMAGYKAKQERQLDYDNYIAYMGGIYVRDALASTVGNMFKKKTQKPIEYPQEPYPVTQQQSEEQIERENEKKRQLFLASLQAMQTNFELNHPNGR